jgi:DNA-binding XRE family transcriptional regulator
MPWFIMKHGRSNPVEAFRSEGEARKALAEYDNKHYVSFSPSCKLQAVRVLRKISQTELAEKSGVPVSTIRKYESLQKNINKASGETLLKLATALGTSIEKILESS